MLYAKQHDIHCLVLCVGAHYRVLVASYNQWIPSLLTTYLTRRVDN